MRTNPAQRRWMLMAALAAMMLCARGHAGAADAARPIPVPHSPMGWSSWNSFSNTVDAQIIMAQARAMVASGMQKAGYQYINIDEGWWLGKRDADGNIVVDEKAWPALAAGEKPGDMANIVRFIHALGLKAGIYTDAGRDGCSMFPDLGPKYFNTGSEGHYEQDFLQFAKWGFDYVKVDWCGGDKENLDPAVQYAEIARAIAKAEKATGHQLYLSLCEWGKQSPWTWAPHVGGAPADIWRTSGDIVDPIVASGEHRDRKAGFDKMLANFDQGIHPEAQHTGFYNDPDMMVLGMPGFSDQQNRVHMSLWAMSGAPLLVGADLAKLSPDTQATLTNAAVLAVDQDALGLQAVKVAEPATGVQVWVKALSDEGAKAVLLLNRTASQAEIAVNWKELGFVEASEATVTDLWSGRKLGSFKGSYAAQVSASDAVLLVIKGALAPRVVYQMDANGKLERRDGGELKFVHVAAHAPWARVIIRYINRGNAARYAELRVNGQVATKIAFPPTGAEPESASIMALLDRPGATNVLNFAADDDLAPLIESITVE
jgi:Alpha galactosidase A/Alpha galactosidase C-terminal beta sandwich domain